MVALATIHTRSVINADVIRETVRWIEEHLRDDLPVTVIARKSGYSLHHFIRLFGGVVGLSPKEYVLRRKLTESARELARGRQRVTDVAFAFGFKDLETFTRAFRREMGITPSAARRGATFAALDPAGVWPGRAAAPSCISGAPSVEQVPSFLIAGWVIRVCEETDAVGRLWSRFAIRASSIPRRRDPPRFFQLASWTEESEDCVDIMVGVEIADLAELPVDVAGKCVPGCTCLVFTHEGSMVRIGESYRAVYRDWLPRLTFRPTLPFNFERYLGPQNDPYAEDYRMQICVPVAKDVK